MNTFNPFQILSNSFSQEKVNEQQVKTAEILQNLNSQAQKQFSKVPQRIQETTDVATHNFHSLQNAIQQSFNSFQKPQNMMDIWSKHVAETYERNLSLFQKHHAENLETLNEVKNHFEQTSNKVKVEAEENFKNLQEKTSEVLTEVQKNFSNVQSDLKENIETTQKQVVKSVQDAVQKTTDLQTQLHEQVSKGFSTLNQVVSDTTAAAQSAVKNAKKTTK